MCYFTRFGTHVRRDWCCYLFGYFACYCIDGFFCSIDLFLSSSRRWMFFGRSYCLFCCSGLLISRSDDFFFRSHKEMKNKLFTTYTDATKNQEHIALHKYLVIDKSIYRYLAKKNPANRRGWGWRDLNISYPTYRWSGWIILGIAIPRKWRFQPWRLPWLTINKFCFPCIYCNYFNHNNKFFWTTKTLVKYDDTHILDLVICFLIFNY